MCRVIIFDVDYTVNKDRVPGVKPCIFQFCTTQLYKAHTLEIEGTLTH